MIAILCPNWKIEFAEKLIDSQVYDDKQQCNKLLLNYLKEAQ